MIKRQISIFLGLALALWLGLMTLSPAAAELIVDGGKRLGSVAILAGTAQIGTVKTKPSLMDVTIHPVSGTLTFDGTQWGTAGSSVTTDTQYAVFTTTFRPSSTLTGTIKELELGLTHRWAAGNATADVDFQWQGKNATGSTWVDLMSPMTKSNINTTNVETTTLGYFEPQTNLNQVPFDMRLLVRSNEGWVTGTVTVSVKNSSYIRAIWEPD